MSVLTVQDITNKLVSMGVPKYDFRNDALNDFCDAPETLHWCSINRGESLAPQNPDQTALTTSIRIVSGDDEPWVIWVHSCRCCDNIQCWQCLLCDYDNDNDDPPMRRVLELQCFPGVEVAIQMARTLSTIECLSE